MEIEGIELKKAPFYAQHIGSPSASYLETHEISPSRSRPGMSFVQVDGYNYSYKPNPKYKTYNGKPVEIGIFNRKSFYPESKKNNYVAVLKGYGFGILNGKSLTDLVKQTNAYLDSRSDILEHFKSDPRQVAMSQEIVSLYKNKANIPTTASKSKSTTKAKPTVKDVAKSKAEKTETKKKSLPKTVKSPAKLYDPKKPRISWKMGAIPTRGADRALWAIVEEKNGVWKASFTGNPPLGRERDNHAPFNVVESVKLNGTEIPADVKVQLGMFSTKFNPNGMPIFKKIYGYKPKIKYKLPKQKKINKLTRATKSR